MLETDSPFLSPKPYRGKRNESAYVKFVAEKLAGIKGLSLQDVAQATSTNADNLFGWHNFPSPINS
jgi:TatD DNase family protein